MNVQNRLKNPWFWVGLVGVILSALGINPEMLNSWTAVINAIKDLFSNPFMLGTVTFAVLGVFVDPSTRGLGDKTADIVTDVIEVITDEVITDEFREDFKNTEITTDEVVTEVIMDKEATI